MSSTLQGFDSPAKFRCLGFLGGVQHPFIVADRTGIGTWMSGMLSSPRRNSRKPSDMIKKLLQSLDVFEVYAGEYLLPIVLGWAFVNVTITIFMEASR